MIVGPGADEHWQVILDGVDAVTEFPLEHLHTELERPAPDGG
ncbi:hypothetical protein [Herbiconiux sp. VKM Ac-1786]|nr:hypothetical protein [Herbiconiux sp. VKM Ac-1786]